MKLRLFLSKSFNMKDFGKAYFVFGIQIHWDRSRGILGLSQESYIEKVLKMYGMRGCKPEDAHIAKGDKFGLAQCLKNNLEIEEM